MTDELDRWTCHWCGWRHPVADFVERHQDECVARPVKGVA